MPSDAPPVTCVMASGCRPLAMTVAVPDRAASRAALSLVAIPPRPSALPAPALEVVSLDAPVLAIDEPSPIVFLRGEQIKGESWHFNCFNNAWNVNYPVWEINSSERFRFELRL